MVSLTRPPAMATGVTAATTTTTRRMARGAPIRELLHLLWNQGVAPFPTRSGASAGARREGDRGSKRRWRKGSGEVERSGKEVERRRRQDLGGEGGRGVLQRVGTRHDVSRELNLREGIWFESCCIDCGSAEEHDRSAHVNFINIFKKIVEPGSVSSRLNLALFDVFPLCIHTYNKSNR